MGFVTPIVMMLGCVLIHFKKGVITYFDIFLFVFVFIIAKIGLEFIIGSSLQEAVNILDLPYHLRDRVVYSWRNVRDVNHKEKDEQGSKVKNKENCKKKIYIGHRFINKAFKFTILKLFNIAEKGNSSLPYISKRGNRKYIANELVEVKIRKNQQDYFRGSSKVSGSKVENCEKDSVGYWTGKKRKRQSGNLGGRHFWLCKLCASSPEWKGMENDFDFSCIKREENFSVSDFNLSDRNFHEEKHCCVTNFMEKDGKVITEENGSRKCKYLDHLLGQLPVERLSAKARLLILLSSPVWFFHLLFDGKDLELIAPGKYWEWEDSLMGKIVVDPVPPREVIKDIVIREAVVGTIGVLLAYAVLP